MLIYLNDVSALYHRIVLWYRYYVCIGIEMNHVIGMIIIIIIIDAVIYIHIHSFTWLNIKVSFESDI